MNVEEKILKEFDNKYNLYMQLETKISTLIKYLLDKNNIAVHNVDHRTKKIESLSKKIERNKTRVIYGEKDVIEYKTLTDITDITGFRIITYLESTIDQVSELIKEEFNIDVENSVDKKMLLAENQFGYRSVHYIVTINKAKINLPEYADF